MSEQCPTCGCPTECAEGAYERVLAQRDRLAEALRPFADVAYIFDHCHADTVISPNIPVSDYREARAALAQCAGTPNAARPRLRACVEAWPDCYEGGYNPRCCRFPKSCSCTVYDDNDVTDADLEL